MLLSHNFLIEGKNSRRLNRDYSDALGVNWGASAISNSGVSLSASSILQGASSSSVGAWLCKFKVYS